MTQESMMGQTLKAESYCITYMDHVHVITCVGQGNEFTPL